MIISRRNFLCALGAVAGGTALKLRASDTPFPEACGVQSLPVPGPAGWAGKTALFITDIHYSNYFGPSEAAALNQIARQHRPDLVLMGGDLAEHPQTDLSDFFTHWSPGCPTLFAPGNHDMSRRSDDRIMQQAREAGLLVLCNEAERWNGITFIGFPSALRAAPVWKLLNEPGFKILLAHEPDLWSEFELAHDLLQLAGHTHGGQIRLLGQPLCLPELGRKYPLGKFSRAADNVLMVSAGIGCSDVHARINCPPEIIKLQFT